MSPAIRGEWYPPLCSRTDPRRTRRRSRPVRTHFLVHLHKEIASAPRLPLPHWGKDSAHWTRRRSKCIRGGGQRVNRLISKTSRETYRFGDFRLATRT